MKGKIVMFLLAISYVLNYSELRSQVTVTSGKPELLLYDTISGKGFIMKILREKPDIYLNTEKALQYLEKWYKADNWNNPADPLRKSIGQLIFYASNNPYDSTKNFINGYSFDSINIPWDKFYSWDTLRVKIPIVHPPRSTIPSDSALKADTILKKNINDSLRLRNASDLTGFLSKSDNPLVVLKDTIILIARDTIHEFTSGSKNFPFKKYEWPYEGDSILVAINSLIYYIEGRDSSMINLSGAYNSVTPIWLNSKSDRLVRFWLKNESADSVAIWAGSNARDTLRLFLEEGIIFRRPTKQSNFFNAQLTLKHINSEKLHAINKAYIKPRYWKYRSESSLVLNQASLTNWVKGGESSVSTSMDITGYADYDNKKMFLLSNNFARLKYGYVASGKEGIRKNIDLLETNSKLNHKAFGKFDFSAIMLFKTQVGKGYNYPNDSVPVSKFLNPAVFTFGLGLDYKPNKNTSVNFSPLSYKVTFVTDTGKIPPHIDQTQYGISRNKKSLHEPGVSLLISNEIKPYNNITVINRLQLFTNYIHNPQNIDVDWEMIANASLNWFTDVRFNTHLIFDDDIKTPVLDKKGKPVLDEHGIMKKTARIQFKEVLGFSFVFRF